MKVSHYIKHLTPSINAYLLEEQSGRVLA